MKNKDIVEALERVQAAAEVELAILIEQMRDDGWEEYDIQAIEYAKKDVQVALLRIADQFPTDTPPRVLQPSPMSYEKFRERYKLPDDEQARADYQEYLQPGTLTAMLADLQGDGPIRTGEKPKM